MTKAKYDEHYILRYTMPLLYHIVPKSIAKQGFDLDTFIKKLQNHLGKPS